MIDEYLGFSIREMAGLYKIINHQLTGMWLGHPYIDLPTLEYKELMELSDLLEKTLSRYYRPKKEGELYITVVDEILKNTQKTKD